MKLLFITRKYPPAIGGMELFAKDLSDHLSALVDLKLVKWSGYGQLKALLLGVPLLTIKSFAALLTNKIDIIHAQDGVLAPLGWLLSRLFHKPFTVVIHGLDITFANPLFRAVVPAAARRANKVFCISQSAADEVLKLGVKPDKVVVIPIAANDVIYNPELTKSDLLSQLDLPVGSQLLLTVGRLTKRKGVAWFIEAVLPTLAQRFPNIIYLVMGTGSQQAAIEAAIEKSGMKSHVRLLGRVEDDLYQIAYNCADVFVMPNINVPGDMEGFGLVNLEAALCRLPVVAADTEGIHDAIQDGQNGVLVPVEDAKGFAVKIDYFLNNSREATQFGAHAREFTLARYDWRAIASRYVDGYTQILNSRKS